MYIFPILAAFGVATLTLLLLSAKTQQEKKFDGFLATIQVALEIVVLILAVGLAQLFVGPLSLIFWLITAIMAVVIILGLGILALRIIFR